MKRVMIFGVLLGYCFGLNQVLAFPSVGDRVRYEAPYQGAVVIQEREIMHQDAAGEVFGVHTITTYRGRVVEEKWVDLPKSFLYTPEKIEEVIRNCVKREGALSDLMVLGLRMRVCEFYHEDSQLTYILGPVPFGLIRFQVYLEDEEFLDFHLTDVRFKEAGSP
ncbi:MAG: hypothetical protein KGP28_06340 [Bdellovibrionales bacterium]|nr:hypothetical protein [Bdellovibrionales bacterium]